MRVRAVPAPSSRPSFVNHARLRRTSPIAQHTVGAALEALGENANATNGANRLGVIVCVMSGCVNYSRRFYAETLKDPATASPLVFPETVFNAPASHISAVLQSNAINYTLVGDGATFLQGLALAADWLSQNQVDGCLVIGAEELDWLTTEAYRIFDQNTVVSDGAGALYLRRQATAIPAIQLSAITEAHIFSKNKSRAEAARCARAQLNGCDPGTLLCDGLAGTSRMDREEAEAWRDWTGARISPKRILGEASAASAAWQCIAAIDTLIQGDYSSAIVNIVGANQQAIAAKFVKPPGIEPNP